MKMIELWLWQVTDAVSGRRYTTRYHLSESSALDLDPTAERVPGSVERRPVRNGSAARGAPAKAADRAREPSLG